MQWFVSETPIHYSLSMVELQISTSVLLITEGVSISVVTLLALTSVNAEMDSDPPTMASLVLVCMYVCICRTFTIYMIIIFRCLLIAVWLFSTYNLFRY